MKNLSVSVALLMAAPVLVAQCDTPPGASMMQNNVLFDGWTAETPLGFAFPFEGNTYTHVYISDHSLVALNNAGVPAAPPGAAAVWTPGAAFLMVPNQNIIAPYWSDHTLRGGSATPGVGEIWIDNTNGSECTITWLDVETYNATAGAATVFTVSLTLYISGEFEFRYDNRVNNDGSSYGALEAVVGVAPDGSMPTVVDMSAGPVDPNSGILEEFVTTAAATPNPNFDLQAKTLRFIPTSPGWLVVVGNGDCAYKEQFGAGCDSLSADSNFPVLGGTWDITTSGLSAISPIAISFFGTGRVDPGLPLSIAGINSPGCSVHFSGLLTSADAPAVGGSATLNVPIPNNPGLLGGSLVTQSVGLTLAVPSLIATSNGVEGYFGL